MVSRADLHIHTTFSDGTQAPEDVLNYYAVHPDIHVVAITDHDTLDGALRVRDHVTRHPDVFHGLEVIVGMEVSSRDGHIVGLFLDRWIPPNLPAGETIARIHEQGGLAIAAHPYTHLMRFAGLKGVGDLILREPFDAIETRNANMTECYANLWTAHRVRAHGLCAVGSSDGHFDDAIGCCYTLFEGATAEDLRTAIVRRSTRAAGRVYGPATLGRYVWRRLRSGQPILPRRSEYVYQAPDATFRVSVSDRSSLHAVVLACHGRLDAVSGQPLKEKLLAIPEADIDVVLNLQDLTGIDSIGLTCLIAGLKAAARHGRRLHLVGLPANVRTVFEMARLAHVFEIFPTEDAALAHVRADAA